MGFDLQQLFIGKRVRPTISSIKSRFFFDKATYSWFFTCYILRVTKRDSNGNKVRGWLLNGSLTEIWIPDRDLRWTMKLMSKYFDYKDAKAGKVLIGE